LTRIKKKGRKPFFSFKKHLIPEENAQKSGDFWRAEKEVKTPKVRFKYHHLLLLLIKMEMKVKHKERKNLASGLVSLMVTGIVISLLILSGPANALTIASTQPNNAIKGGDVSFDITINIINPDSYVPVQYTSIIFTGPNYNKTCTVDLNGTNDCPDVDISVVSSASDPTYGYGYGYGYDNSSRYNFGYGYGYNDGSITYHVVWHTSTSLTDGTYYVKGETYVKGTGIGISHTFSSSQKSFLISNPSTGGTNGPYYKFEGILITPVNTTNAINASTTITPSETNNPTNTSDEVNSPATTGRPGITGGVIGAVPTSIWIIVGALIVLAAAFFSVRAVRIRKRRKHKD